MEQVKNQVEEIPKKKWRHILIEYFMEIIQAEQNLDSLRQSLNQQNNFSVQNIFNILDNDNKGYLTLGDFLNFLEHSAIFSRVLRPTPREGIFTTLQNAILSFGFTIR